MRDINIFRDLLKKHSEDNSQSEDKLELTDEQKSILLEIVRNTIKSYLKLGEIPEVIIDDPVFSEPRATFVTLRSKVNNELRGCKGEILPTKPLLKSVQNTAVSAAFNDPRFPRVELHELENLKTEINILMPIKPIKYTDIILGVHGLILVKNDCSALFLPQVPVTYKFDRERYLAELCIKAGLVEDGWKDKDTSLYGFESVTIEEN